MDPAKLFAHAAKVCLWVAKNQLAANLHDVLGDLYTPWISGRRFNIYIPTKEIAIDTSRGHHGSVIVT
jgi:hypothetical protein